MAVQHECHAALVPLGINIAEHHHAGSGVFEILLLVDSEILAPAGAQTAARKATKAEILIIFMLSPFRGRRSSLLQGRRIKVRFFSDILPFGYEKMREVSGLNSYAF